MHRTALFLVAGLTLLPTVSRAQSPGLAVLPTQLEGKAKELVPSIIDDYILTAVQSAVGSSVVGQSDIQAMLSFEQQKDLAGCDDVSCIAQIGGALGVEKIVVVRIARVDDSWATSAKLMVIVGAPTVEARAARFIDGDVKRLLEEVPALIGELFGKKVAVSPPASAAPAPTTSSPPPTPSAATPNRPKPPPKPFVPYQPKTLLGANVGLARLSGDGGSITGWGFDAWWGSRILGGLALGLVLDYGRFTETIIRVDYTVSRLGGGGELRYDLGIGNLFEVGLRAGLEVARYSAPGALETDGSISNTSFYRGVFLYGLDAIVTLGRTLGVVMRFSGASDIAGGGDPDDPPKSTFVLIAAGLRLAL